MALEGRHAVGIPTNEESRSQRIIAVRHFANVCDTPAAAFARWQKLRNLFELQGVKAWLGVRQQSGGKVHADRDGDEKICQRYGEQDGGNFHDTPGAAPAHTLRIVKYRSAFLHETFQTGGTVGLWK